MGDVVASIYILLASAAMTLLSEGLAYVAVYRRGEYQRAVIRVVDVNRKLEKEKELLVGVEKRERHAKKIQKLEADFKEAMAKMNGMKLVVNITIGLLYMLAYRVLSMRFHGQVVGTLPFIPFEMMRRMSMRGLPSGSEPTDCAFAFVYALAALGLKGTIQKAMGFAPPRVDLGKVKWSLCIHSQWIG
mmetsp:Transcript_4423/g.8726  ORF Transcript_4423/g.8726 Transcript_4423/m.8726 type:complete len:188 (-) Transcript_4423:1574-2137(-)